MKNLFSYLNVIFFLKYLFINIHCEFRLKFKRKFHLENTEENLIENILINNLVINFKVGSNNETIPFILNFYEYALAIMGSDIENNNINQYFNYKNSSSYNIIEENCPFYSHFYSYAIMSSEKFNIQNIFSGEEKFLLITQLSKDFKNYKIYFPGILGLNISPLKNVKNIKNYNFIESLKEKNLIDSYSFIVNYSSEDEGEIIFGIKNYNNDYKNNKIAHTRALQINLNLKWSIVFDIIKYGNQSLEKFSDQGIFRIELGIIIGTNELKIKVKKSFFDYYINQNKCKEITKDDEQTYFNSKTSFICDDDINLTNFKNLSFELKEINTTFIFTYKDLFQKIKNKYVFLIYFNEYGRGWEFGKPFFKRYNIIFDQDKKIIGIHRKINYKNENNYSSTFIIIILILIILYLLGYIINYLINKKSKKIRANELEDDYEYKIKFELVK
jgi:hypothetical protein